MTTADAQKAKGRRKPALSTLGSSDSSASIGRTPDRRHPSAGYRPTSAAELRELSTTTKAGAADVAKRSNAEVLRDPGHHGRPGGFAGSNPAVGGAALGSSGDVSPSLQIGTFSETESYNKGLDRLRLRDRARHAWRIVGLLQNDDPCRSQRLCGMVPLDGVGGVEMRQRIDGTVGGQAVGTMSCGSSNAVCPVCTAKVREERRREIAAMVERGQSLGYRFAFVTATLRHTRDTGPAQQREALESAWRAVTTGRDAQDRRNCGQVAGTVRAIEFMLEGPAGPHGHVHAIIAVAPNVTARGVISAMDAMRAKWCEWAERNMDGLRPNHAHGWQWEMAIDAADVARYVVKLVDGEAWNISHEIARGDTKRGRGGSLAPLELLARAVDEYEATGDVRAMLRMADYARAVKGMRSIVVSRSFRQLMAVEDDDGDDDDATWETVGVIPIEAWNILARRIGVANIIDAAARHGTAGIEALLHEAQGLCRDTG